MVQLGDIQKINGAEVPIVDVVCFGSGSTGRACLETGRNFYGFEINKEFYRRAKEEMCVLPKDNQMSIEDFL